MLHLQSPSASAAGLGELVAICSGLVLFLNMFFCSMAVSRPENPAGFPVKSDLAVLPLSSNRDSDLGQ